MKNRRSKTGKWYPILLLVTILGIGPVAFAKTWQDQVVQRQVEKLKARVLDFYQRLDAEDTADRAHEKAASTMRSIRKNRSDKFERARAQYVITRKTKTEPSEAAWDLELKRRAQIYQENRERYIERRDQVQRAMSRVWQIPGDAEFDLDQND